MSTQKIFVNGTPIPTTGQILMNEKDAAAYLSWSVKTLQARRHLCKPPRYRKIGRSVRYVLADLQAFVESCTVEPMA
jgi:predicted DNA-binding transcriptional regulator AlpA